MTRINLILFGVLILVSLGVISSQHKSRGLNDQYEQLTQLTKYYQTEFGQLQIEQSTYAMHSKVEEYAQSKLNMQVPDVKRIQVINLEDEQ